MGIIVLIRFMIFVFLGWLVFRMLRNWLKKRNPEIKKTTNENIDTMIPCAQCGVHFPRRTAIEKDQQFFCCEEHKNNYNK